MTEVLSIVVDVTVYLFAPIKSQIDYVFNCSENVEDLNKKVEKLTDARKRVQHSVDDARKKGEEIEDDVKKWLISVGKIIDEANEIIKAEDEANKGCFIGLCPNLKMRYQLSKQATEKAKAVVELQGEGKFDKVSYRSIPQGIWPASIKGYDTFESRMSTFKDILEALTDPNISVLGVYGMGGIGKTTLVKEVARHAKEQKLFDEVVFAAVSQTPDIKKIQGEIADKLGLEFHKETEFGRAIRLCERLKKDQKILVILVDVWARLNLEAVGIPFGDDHKGCKILLTSSSEDVLSCEMDTQNNFSVGVLTEKESWNLFKKMAGDFVESPDLQSIAIEVAKKCAGLPIAIVTVARALRNKTLVEWKNALRQLKRPSSTNFTGMQAVVYSTIELSYNHLECEELKSTFLLCGIMGNNAYSLDLLKYGIGLGLFQGINRIEEARDRVYALVCKLKASCLLLDSYTDERFAMHDVVRDVAISIASRDQHVLAVRNEVGPTEWPNKDILKNCTAISLRDNDIAELPKELECPQVKFFYMNSKDHSLKIPDDFFKKMTELRVLDLTGMHFLSLPSSLLLLANLQTLCLDQCMLGKIAIIGELKKLEVLSFLSSDIEQLPAEMTQLTQLKLLDLSDCFRLKVIPLNVISSFSQLEELHMGNSFIQWEVEGNASLTELKHLSHLTTLHIHIPDANILPKDLFTKKLERYRIFIGDEWDWFSKYETSRTLKLKLNTSIHQEDGIIMLLKRAEDLYLDELKGVKNVFYELDREGFPQLKHLHVQNGPNFECIINSMEWGPCDAFPILESIFLHNLINLQKICVGQLTAASFSKLRIIKVGNCNSLKNLFTVSMARGLSQLQKIKVIDCMIMEEIIEEGRDDDVQSNEVFDKIEFTQLRSVTLQSLPKLTSFCSERKSPSVSQEQNLLTTNSGSKEIVSEEEHDIHIKMPLINEKVVFPNLEKLKLSAINVEKILHNQLPPMSSSIQNLTRLIVEGCDNLKYLFSSSMVQSFVQLKHLEICKCSILEEIIVTEGTGEEEVKDKMKFPSLKTLYIEHCPELKAFIFKSISTNNTAGKEVEEMNSVENHHTGIQPFFNEMVAFPSLEEMVISHVDNLKMLWHNQLPPNSFGKLKSLKVEYCEKLLTIFPCNTVGRFCRLESLIITDCGSLEGVFELQGLNIEESHPVADIQLRKLYIYRLPKLKHVWNKDPEGIFSFQNLHLVRAFECQSLRNLFPASVARGLLQLEELQVDTCGVEQIVAKEKGIKATNRFVFPRLTSLILWNLQELSSFYPGMHTSEWPLLKRLEVYECPKVKTFASELLRLQETHWEGQVDIPMQQPLFYVEKVIPNLEELLLNSEDIKMIWHGQFPVDLFHKLKVLHVTNFHDKSAIFLFGFLQRFHNLENLDVLCSHFEELFPYEGLVREEKHAETLAQIRHLRLRSLPNLKHIWKQDSRLKPVLQNLETLEVWHCCSLTNLAPLSASFQNLMTLDVSNCEELKYLLTSSTAKSLVQLIKMSIKECAMVTEIVASDQGDEPKDEIIFNKLKCLGLHCLPSLTSFCSSNQTFKFPILEEVIVRKCPKMINFCQGVLSTPKLQRVQLTEEKVEGRWEGDLNTTIQLLHTEMVTEA